MWFNYEIASGLIEKSAEEKKGCNGPRMGQECFRVFQQLNLTLKVVMGQECFRVFQQLNLTDEQRNSSAAIINHLNNYYVPKTNIIYERFKFNTRQSICKRVN